jgi:hypothetical protein
MRCFIGEIAKRVLAAVKWFAAYRDCPGRKYSIALIRSWFGTFLTLNSDATPIKSGYNFRGLKSIDNYL